MSRFPSSLPTDVVYIIFSFLEQNDCITCMRVCRQWYREFPLYGRDMWKQITISKSSSKTNKCMNNCLIPHVQDVHIEKLDTIPVLNRLKHMGCILNSLGQLSKISLHGTPAANTSSSLDIKWHWLPVQTIEDHEAADIIFLSAIRQFSYTLKELSITHHPSNVPLSKMICSFPNLTHLTVLFDPSSPSIGLSSSKENVTDGTSSLVYLHLDSVLSFNHRIVPILRRCPKLTTLHLSHDYRRQILAPANFDMIFELCPHLRHFAWDETDYKRTSRMKALPVDENGGGIRDFVFRGSVDDMDKTVSILIKSRLSLERLELSNEGFTAATEWNPLAHLDFPRLKSLYLGQLYISPNEWGPFFAHRPNLKSLRHLPLGTDDPLMDDLISAISSLKDLEYLMIFNHNSLSTGRQPDVWSNAWMLSCNTNLQYLALAYVDLSDSVLLDLCTIQSLTELSLHSNGEDKITSKGLCAFAKRLADSNSNLGYLVLGYFKNMDDPVLEQLAHVKKLAFIKLSGTDKITDAGLRSFVQGTSGGARKKAFVEYCRSVKRSGLWTD